MEGVAVVAMGQQQQGGAARAGAERARTERAGASGRASLAQLVEHALRKHMVMGSIPIGGFIEAWLVLLSMGYEAEENHASYRARVA